MDRHDYVARLKALAADLGRTPTRDEFRQQPFVTDHMIKKMFGNYSVLVQAAGLKQHIQNSSKNRAKTPYEKELEKYSAHKLLESKYTEDIALLSEKFVLPQDKSSGIRLAVCSDLHSIYLDPFAWFIFLDVCKRLKPKIVVLDGDVVDFYAISHYSKDPSRASGIGSEIKFVKDNIFSPLRKILPDAQIDFILGNHELRLWKFLVSQAPAIMDLESLSYEKIFGLDEFKINLIANKSILNPKSKGDSFKIYGDCYLITHGTKLTSSHAGAELNTWNMSGCSGHVHHYQVHSKRDLGQGSKTWTSMGCMCRLESGKEYCDFPRWQQGFMIADIYNKEVSTQYVSIGDNFCSAFGKHYHRSLHKAF